MTAPAAGTLPLVAALGELAARLETELARHDAGGPPGELLARFTPTSAGLLRWWFGESACATRPVRFHAGQRQAILHTLIAHELFDAADLGGLHAGLGLLDALDPAQRAGFDKPRHRHPKYCLKMATGTGKTWVLQALLVWQWANHRAACAAGRDDPRFTRRFLVVAPGLIVYERLLDAFLGRRGGDGERDPDSADLVRHAELFVPPELRAPLRQFVLANLCEKHEIGRKCTGNGLLALTNWHLLAETTERPDDKAADLDDALAAEEHGAYRVLPLAPGRGAGNELERLDRRHGRDDPLAALAALPDLLVFNDEAHHVHALRAGEDDSEVEWQKSLLRLARDKGRRFIQVDFSATPYNDLGNGRKAYFPHIVADFDLRAALGAGLVKSLVLDRRKDIAALPLDFLAEHDADGRLRLSEGQRLMIRAGLGKRERLERDFAVLDPRRTPKLLVVCEDTAVAALVEAFLLEEGLPADDVLRIDSGRRAELGEREWAPLRRRLSSLDAGPQPRVLVSVLMLREGFDAETICVIVPLRASRAAILVEQTVGRGLRLMWRGEVYEALRRENRERIDHGEEPSSLIDILSIIEHPAFARFYDELRDAGLLVHGSDAPVAGTGDLITIGLRDGYERYDFSVPVLVEEAEERLEHADFDEGALPPFSGPSREALAELLGRGDTFTSLDLQSATLFGDYRVDGAVLQAGGYNELLSRLTRRIAQALSQPLAGGTRVAPRQPRPYLQTRGAWLAQRLDRYIRGRLFGAPFDPLADDGWRLLLVRPVHEHLVRVFALALVCAERRRPGQPARVQTRSLSEVAQLTVRAGEVLAVRKCLYTHLPLPGRHTGLERAFIEWAECDTGIRAYCRISEQRHPFVHLPYLREDGRPARYSPDFLVRGERATYLVETKAENQLNHPDVRRKAAAAGAWCARLDAVPEARPDGLPWRYALVGEALFHDWRRRGARLEDLLALASLYRPAVAGDQGRLRLEAPRDMI
ncbi:DEAD/DEAH box helicase family protein [Pseudomonas mangiferae]|uniref:Restriction endonuclease subunit R n=1 Tax=Pseudomonas mangiferae TaxID=2593654 RepID=A0A553GVS6_9PSED|nr:DEAD/DEAH box helicase family protein [Pseudomonas mangiferae]TRX73614.1 restriction endonuclease subunit R [Pseudomonas mangiferae]